MTRSYQIKYCNIFVPQEEICEIINNDYSIWPIANHGRVLYHCGRILDTLTIWYSDSIIFLEESGSVLPGNRKREDGTLSRFSRENARVALFFFFVIWPHNKMFRSVCVRRVPCFTFPPDKRDRFSFTWRFILGIYHLPTHRCFAFAIFDPTFSIFSCSYFLSLLFLVSHSFFFLPFFLSDLALTSTLSEFMRAAKRNNNSNWCTFAPSQGTYSNSVFFNLCSVFSRKIWSEFKIKNSPAIIFLEPFI